MTVAITDSSDDASKVFAQSNPRLTGSTSARFRWVATGSATFGGALGSTDAEAAFTRDPSHAIRTAGSLITVAEAGGDATDVFERSVPGLTGWSSTPSWRRGSTDADAISDDGDDAPEVFATPIPGLIGLSSTGFCRIATFGASSRDGDQSFQTMVITNSR
jgi:hypothetical protein